MASIYKKLGVNDTTKTTTNLHESIPITGTILSGTYGTFPSGNNAKYFSANDHVDVYDYPYASSSANMMFSLTAGVSEDAPLNDHIKSQKAKKMLGTIKIIMLLNLIFPALLSQNLATRSWEAPEMAVQALRPLLALVLKLLFLWTFPGC